MKILAVETTGERLGLAVSVEGRIWHKSLLAPGRQDELLWARTEKLLKAAHLELKDFDALAAACGPGSFTGVRVGMTFVSVLARTLGLPAVAVTLFEAEAAREERDGVLAVVFPARRGELFFQAFAGSEPVRESALLAPLAWPKAMADAAAGRSVTLAGPAAEEAAALLSHKPAGIEVRRTPPPDAGLVARAAAVKLERGGAGEFSPLYLQAAYYERAVHPKSRV